MSEIISKLSYEGLDEGDKEQERERVLEGLIDDYARREEEDIEKSNPFRDKTKAEKLKAFVLKNGAKLGIYTLFAGGAVVLGGVALPTTLATMGGAMVSSYIGRGVAEVARHKLGVAKKDEENRKRLRDIYSERQNKISKLARKVNDAEYVEYESDEEHDNAVKEAKLELLDFIIEISNNENSENKEYESKKNELLKSRKKWAWIRAGSSIAAGILGGGAIAEIFKDKISEHFATEGIDVAATKHGLGWLSEKYGILQEKAEATRHIHQVTDSSGGSEVVFDVDPEKVDAIRGIIEAHPEQYGDYFDTTAHATKLANQGMHEAGAALTTEFKQQVSEMTKEAVGSLWAGVASSSVSGEVVELMSRKRKDFYDLDGNSDKGRGEFIAREQEDFRNDAKNKIERLSETQSRAEGAEARVGGEIPEVGEIVELSNDSGFRRDSKLESEALMQCKYFRVKGLSGDGKFLAVSPITSEGTNYQYENGDGKKVDFEYCVPLKYLGGDDYVKVDPERTKKYNGMISESQRTDAEGERERDVADEGSDEKTEDAKKAEQDELGEKEHKDAFKPGAKWRTMKNVSFLAIMPDEGGDSYRLGLMVAKPDKEIISKGVSTSGKEKRVKLGVGDKEYFVEIGDLVNNMTPEFIDNIKDQDKKKTAGEKFIKWAKEEYGLKDESIVIYNYDKEKKEVIFKIGNEDLAIKKGNRISSHIDFGGERKKWIFDIDEIMEDENGGFAGVKFTPSGKEEKLDIKLDELILLIKNGFRLENK